MNFIGSREEDRKISKGSRRKMRRNTVGAESDTGRGVRKAGERGGRTLLVGTGRDARKGRVREAGERGGEGSLLWTQRDRGAVRGACRKMRMNRSMQKG